MSTPFNSNHLIVTDEELNQIVNALVHLAQSSTACRTYETSPEFIDKLATKVAT